MILKNRYYLILVWFFATGILYFFLRSIDLNQALNAISGAEPFWLLLAVIFNSCILLVWSSLWYLLVPERKLVPFCRVFQANALMSTSCNIIPFPGGHAVGVLALARRFEVGNSVALSILALDQLMEGFAKIFVLTLIAILVPLPDQMVKGVLIFVAFVSLFASVMFYLAHKLPNNTDEPENYFQQAKVFIACWAAHLHILRDFKTFALGLLLALLMMSTQTLGIWAVQKSFGLDLHLWTPILVMGALNLTTILPVTPGNLGIYEGTAYFVYQFCGVSSELALSISFLQHLCFLIPMVGTGYLVLLLQTSAGSNISVNEKMSP